MALEVGSPSVVLAPPRSSSRALACDRADALALVAALLVGVLAPALLALATHSLDVPRNDDWAFRRVLFGFTRTGHYSLVGWGSMTLVGQVLWTSAFVLALGAHPWVPAVAVEALAAAGLASCYLLARAQLGRARALACTLLVVSLPGFALSTSSFMTDVPAFSGEMVCLLFGAFALRSTELGRRGSGSASTEGAPHARSPGERQLFWLGASMVAGVFAFSIREFAVAALVAVLGGLVWADRRLLAPCLVAGVAAAASCTAMYVWSAGLQGAQPKVLGLPTSTTWHLLGGAYFTLSFMVAPVLPWAMARWRVWRQPVAYVAGGLVLLVGGLLVSRHYPLFIGNYLDRQGAGGDRVLAGVRPELFAGPLWEAFRVTALVAGAALAGVLAGASHELVRSRRRPARSLGLRASSRASTKDGLGTGLPPYEMATGGAGHSRLPMAGPLDGAPAKAERRLALLFAWASVAVLAGYGLFVRAAFWDRYLWPVAFCVALLALGQGWRSRAALSSPRLQSLGLAAAGGLLAALVGTAAVAITLNSDAYDAARWSAGRDLVRAGYPASAVDAGFDWVGAHARAPAQPGRALAGAPAYETWYDQMFPGLEDCALVSSSPLLWSSLRLFRTVGYDELAIATPAHLYLYLVDNASCAAIRH
jgi:hypothetical protein